jgi:glycosyltransferase involved in cell wall biosynthesis
MKVSNASQSCETMSPVPEIPVAQNDLFVREEFPDAGKNKLRIMIISNWFPPVVSGSSYYTSSLAQSLVSSGHTVVVVTLDWGVEHAPAADFPCPVYRLPVMKLPKLPLFYGMRLMGMAFTPSNVKRLKKLVEIHTPDVIHHVNHIFDTTFLSAYVARSAKIPLVGSITTPIQHQKPLRHWLMSIADRMTVGFFGVRKWDGVVCLDREVFGYVGRQYGAKVQSRAAVIPFGVRIEALSTYMTGSSDRSGPPQILMVGHIHPFRNPVQLIRAMPKILKEVPDAQLVLAGRVDLQEPVEVARELGLTQKQVQFLGQTSHEETVRLMKNSHAFASWVTGPYPGLGTAPMEAMLCETPVVNDLPEDLFGEGKLKNGENIVLLDSRSPEAIAKGLIPLLKDQAIRKRIGSAGRRFVLEHLSWDEIARQIEDFYIRTRAASKKQKSIAG